MAWTTTSTEPLSQITRFCTTTNQFLKITTCLVCFSSCTKMMNWTSSRCVLFFIFLNLFVCLCFNWCINMSIWIFSRYVICFLFWIYLYLYVSIHLQKVFQFMHKHEYPNLRHGFVMIYISVCLCVCGVCSNFVMNINMQTDWLSCMCLGYVCMLLYLYTCKLHAYIDDLHVYMQLYTCKYVCMIHTCSCLYTYPQANIHTNVHTCIHVCIDTIPSYIWPGIDRTPKKRTRTFSFSIQTQQDAWTDFWTTAYPSRTSSWSALHWTKRIADGQHIETCVQPECKKWTNY
jgi:hypothetical protein